MLSVCIWSGDGDDGDDDVLSSFGQRGYSLILILFLTNLAASPGEEPYVFYTAGSDESGLMGDGVDIDCAALDTAMLWKLYRGSSRCKHAYDC